MSTDPIVVRFCQPVPTGTILFSLAIFPIATSLTVAEQRGQPAARATEERASAPERAGARPGETADDADGPKDDEAAEQRTELAQRWLQAQAEQTRPRSGSDQQKARSSAPLPDRSERHERSSPPPAVGQAPAGRTGQRTDDARHASQEPAGVQDDAAADRSATSGGSEASPSPDADQPTERQAQPTDSPRTYSVQKSDTFSSLARRFYGGTKHWKKIAEANPDVDPGRLKVGQTIQLPRLKDSGSDRRSRAQSREESDTASSARASQERENADDRQTGDGGAAGGSSRTVRVRSGDTLSSIAERAYGDPNLWRRILKANRDRIEEPQRLRVGTELRLPVKPNADDGTS